MTEETIKLFDAPWKPDEHYTEVKNASGYVVCSVSPANVEMRNRISHLPELYDALMWAIVQYCPDAFLFLDECRMCGEKNCKGRECVELLKKVRDGE